MFYCICLTTRNENLRDRPHERPIFQGFCVSPRRQRSWQHCQQLGDLLRVAGGVGSDATAEAVDGRAEAVQLRDKRSRLIATPNCNSHVEADNGNHTFSPPRQICRAWCRAAPRFVAQSVLEPNTLDCHTHLSQRPFVFTTSKRRIRTVGATKRVVTPETRLAKDAPAGLASACR